MMIGVGHVHAYLGWSVFAHGVMVWRLDGNRQHGRPSRGLEDNINTDGRSWTRLIWLRVGMSRCCCEHGDETLGYMKYWGFFF
jgi:hypothetical protein